MIFALVGCILFVAGCVGLTVVVVVEWCREHEARLVAVRGTVPAPRRVTR